MSRKPHRDDYERLPEEDGFGFGFNERIKHRRRRCLAILLVCLLMVFVGVILTVYFLQSVDSSNSNHFQYKHAAVASDVTLCSTIGKNTLENGGNAVDAAIASLLCMGIADAQSMGIGGGFFMTVYNRTTQNAFAVDARETAPELANETMFEGNPLASSTGPLSIAVPGEISGYWLAHQQFGRLPWKDLFTPAISMAEQGFPVPKSLATSFQDSRQQILDEESLRIAFVNNETGKLYKEGEIMKLPQLANTLRKISEGGAAAFYQGGNLTDDILSDLKYIGSIITREDLKNYTALLKKPSIIVLNEGLKVFTPPPPASGVILSFMLNVLDGYNLKPSDANSTDNLVKTMHRMIETFKFAYAKRTDLADEDFVNVSALVANLTSREYADYIRSLITDNTTHNLSYYGPTFYDHLTTSTAHLSIVDAEGNAVSVTSTINARFGSKRRGLLTGIIFNDEMDDFSSPNITNIFGIPPSPANFIVPGKRPLSSMCPAVIVMPSGDARLVIGAAGGSRITTSTAYVTVKELWLNETVEEAVTALRLHHQLLPDILYYEYGFDKEILQGLEKLGHQINGTALGSSIVQAISRHGSLLFADSDFRKGGQPDGY